VGEKPTTFYNNASTKVDALYIGSAMEEYNCPICDEVVGSADKSSRPTFYHCGRRFPTIEENLPDPNQVWGDPGLSVEQKENLLRSMRNNIKTRRGQLNVRYTKALHDSEKFLDKAVRQRNAAVTFGLPGKVRVGNLTDPKIRLKLWAFTLQMHASQEGHQLERETFDDCKSYAIKHGLDVPEWANA
tara:strand:+ start:1118 stop:1678 length:561 start_codon:yes stop_codon:yes gene_type:complete